MALRRISVSVIGIHRRDRNILIHGISNHFDLNEDNREEYLETCIREVAEMNSEHGNFSVEEVEEDYFDEEEQEVRQRLIYKNGEWLDD